MQNNPTRIIIDTNLWISFLITKDFVRLDEIIFSRKAILIFSQELLDEFMEVTARPKFRRFFSSSDIEDILEMVEDYAEFIEVSSEVTACRDYKDNFLLSLAMDGNADFLLTGDNDLLELVKYGKTEILSISDFLGDK